MSEAGMDMLSDMHLSTVSDQPSVKTEQTATQGDLIGLTDDLDCQTDTNTHTSSDRD